MKLKSLKIISIILLILCAFKLGEIQGESNYLKRVTECTKMDKSASMKDFYGHSMTIELWNHAVAHNANIYLKCIFKDLDD